MDSQAITAEDLADFFGRPIAFHRCLVRAAGGSVTAGLLLSQAVYWQRTKGAGEWFFKTALEWCSETGLSRDEFQTARQRLKDAGLIEFQVRGVPATGHYRVVFEAILSSLRDSRKLDCGKAASLLSENPKTSSRGTRRLLTTESSAKNSQRAPRVEKNGINPRWWASPETMLEAAKTLGISTIGQSATELRASINAKLESRKAVA